VTNPQVSTATDVLNALAGIRDGSSLAALRLERADATTHAQGSYDALFHPADTGGLSHLERFAAALRVSSLHQSRAASEHFRVSLQAAGAGQRIVAEVEARPEQRSARGPELDQVVPPRLQAILQHSDLLASRPAQASPHDLQLLARTGFSTREIVSLSQVIAFTSFFTRVLAALQLLGAESPDQVSIAGSVASPEQPREPQPATVLQPPENLERPTKFTAAQLEWTPWLEPLNLASASPKQVAALEGQRANSPYFRLLALDVDVLVERTATDRGIFHTQGGAPHADRQLAAAAASRFTGCIYCTSVHARMAAQLSKREADIERLLQSGVAPGTPLDLDDRWQAVIDAAVALARTPPAATAGHVDRLRNVGLTELEILDVLQASAFFAWANRLMLTLGEPYVPRDQPTRV
jgi:alkylhydroperoxidase domain protein/CMD domain protein